MTASTHAPSAARTTLFTCSVFPELTRVWFHFVRMWIDPERTSVVIYDCGARLDRRLFPGATIVPFSNRVPHGTKIDHCIAEVKTPLVFICDDDIFLTAPMAEETAAQALLGDPNVAIYSFRSRKYWWIEVDGKRQNPVGSYCLVVRPEIFRKERLSFELRSTADPAVRVGSGYYDTADHAQEQLLARGYEVLIAPDGVQEEIPGFFGTSRGFMRFTRRTLFRGRRSRWGRAHGTLNATVAADTEAFELACSVAGTLELYRAIFLSPPSLGEFPTLADLEGVCVSIVEPSRRDAAREILSRSRRAVDSLLRLAGDVPRATPTL